MTLNVGFLANGGSRNSFNPKPSTSVNDAATLSCCPQEPRSKILEGRLYRDHAGQNSIKVDYMGSYMIHTELLQAVCKEF